jgi:hypothetical protein
MLTRLAAELQRQPLQVARGGPDDLLPDRGGPGEGHLVDTGVEADDLTAPVKELRARSASGRTTGNGLPPGPPPVVTIYELLD